MNDPIELKVDPGLDLVLERTVEVPPRLVWAAWTEPVKLKQWFTPAPWQTVGCEIDLRPGGVFKTVMRGPKGPDIVNEGCYLEVIDGQRLVWTGSLRPGFRPRSSVELATIPLFMTAVISLVPAGAGTRYTAHVMHGDQKALGIHQQMGFQTGWGKALDQLVEKARDW